VLLLVAVVFILAFGTACCLFFKDKTQPPSPPLKVANAETAKDLLRSVANGSVLYSALRGGNGKTNFPQKPSDIVDTLPPVVAQALEGCLNTTVPADGYVCRLIPVEVETDFLFEASPVNGYIGDTFIVTRDLKVQKKEVAPAVDQTKTVPDTEKTQENPPQDRSTEQIDSPPQTETALETKQPRKKTQASELIQSAKTKIKNVFDPPPPPPPPIRPANPDSAKEMLQSVYHASKLYSAQGGGNGQSMFPTTPTQIVDLIPEVIKKSIVFLRDEEDKAVPIDGYIMVMYPAQTQNPTDDFCFVAYPANYFTGPHFEITKRGVIKQISPEEGE